MGSGDPNGGDWGKVATGGVLQQDWKADCNQGASLCNHMPAEFWAHSVSLFIYMFQIPEEF